MFSKKFAHRLIEANQKKTTLDKVKVLSGTKLGELAPQPPATNEPRTGLSMGQHCELMAKQWKVRRAEQDQLAFESHRKAAEAFSSGYMDDLVVPFAGVFRDNNVRGDVELEKLGTLKTAFDKSDEGTLTAANSTPLTDGAAAVLLCSEDWARAHGLPIKAFLVDAQHIGNDFVGGDGLLMAPTIARVAKLLERNGLTLQDFDFYEIHEAFAAQVLSTLKAWEDPDYCKRVLGRDSPLGSIDRSKLNVKGSSIAVGASIRGDGCADYGVDGQNCSMKEVAGAGSFRYARPAAWESRAILESAKAGEQEMAA